MKDIKIQEQCSTEREAVERAKELREDNEYVVVIKDTRSGIYYVENEITMVRPFEEIIIEYLNGRESK